MKNKLAKIIALLLVFSFVFAFSACKKDDTETTAAATTAQAEITAGETTAAPGDTTAEATADPGETTTVPAGIVAPIGSDIAKIVAFYNQYANATKEYKGKITVQRKIGTQTTISSMDLPFGFGWLKDVLQGVLDKQLKDKDETKTFVNGQPTEGTETLEKFMPRGGGQKMSVLTPAGVKFASCVAEGSGWKVTITLKKEVMNSLDVPPHHSSVIDKIEIDNESLDPFTLGDGQIVYGQTSAPNNGGTLTAKVNPNGYLDYLKFDAPLQISGKLGYQGKFNIATVIDGKFWGDMTFTYYS